MGHWVGILSSMRHSIRSSCPQSLLKQQWGGIKWSQEVTSSEYMKGDTYFKYCRKLQILQYTEIPKVIKYQCHGCKRKCNTSESEVGAANARKQHEDWGSGEWLPCSWGLTHSCCPMLAMAVHKTQSPFKGILLLGDFEIGPVFFSSSSFFFCHNPLGFTKMLSNSWVTWLLGGYMQFHGKWQTLEPFASPVAHFQLNYTLSPLPSAGAKLRDALQMEKATAAESSALLVGLELLTACS